MAKKKGMEGIFYYSATALADVQDATIAAATWVEVGTVREDSHNVTAGEIDMTARDNAGKKEYAAGLRDAEASFTLVYDPADADVVALKTAVLAGTVLGMAFADGAIATTGTTALVGNFIITSFERGAPLEDAMTANVTVRPASGSFKYYTKS